MNEINTAMKMVDATPEPPIARAATRLSNSVSDLDRAISAVIDKLRPALTPESNMRETGEVKAPGPNSELANFIEEKTDVIYHLITVLEDVHGRIEL